MGLPEAVFGLKWNGDLVHQVVTSAFSSRRGNTAHAKDRSDVAGGGKKPWRQKGTGRARHGSIRSPIWIGGGVAHGPTNETNYDRKINKKMKTKALFTVLSRKFRDGEIVFIDKILLEKPKTAEAKEIISGLNGIKGIKGVLRKKSNAALISLADNTPAVRKSFRNFSNLDITTAAGINIFDVLNYKVLVMVEPESSIKVLSQKLKTKLTTLS